MKRTWTLDKIFGLYTVAFIGVTVLIGFMDDLQHPGSRTDLWTASPEQ